MLCLKQVPMLCLWVNLQFPKASLDKVQGPPADPTQADADARKTVIKQRLKALKAEARQ